MTRSKPHIKLEQALRQWSAAHAPQDAECESLKQRIGAALQQEPVTIAAQPRVMPSAVPGNHRALWLGLGAAGIMLCVLLAGPWLRHAMQVTLGNSDPHTEQTIPPDFAWLVESQLAGKQALFVEMERVFNGNVAWIAETGGEVRIGLAPDDGVAPRDSQRLAVRLVVTRTPEESKVQVPVWAIDLVSVNEQWVRLDDSSGGDQLQIWVYCLPGDDKVAVEANLELAIASRIDASYSRVQQVGTPQLVHAWTADDGEYRVYQTVNYLEGEVL